MARQPFLPAFKHLDIGVGAHVLNNRPEFTSAIGKCIVFWSYADNEIANLLGILLETDSEVATEVFLKLRRSASQIEILQTAAKIKLFGEDCEFYNAMIAAYASLEQERNALAHGCFGVASNDDSVVLWISVKDHARFQTDVLARIARGEIVPDPHKHLKERLFVYRVSDLSALYSEMEQFWDAALNFNSYLRFRPDPAQISSFKRIQQLPLIKRHKRQSTP